MDGYAEGEEKGHPVATGTGALGGAAAGAAVGSGGGSCWYLDGWRYGAVAGSAAGHEIGEAVNLLLLKMLTKTSSSRQWFWGIRWRRSQVQPLVQ